MARNKNRVPKKQWRRWSPLARRVFNDTYDFVVNNPKLMRHPKQPPVKLEYWETTAWNAAWIAADAVDECIPDEVVDAA
jgi:hypothetical protein